MSDFTVIQDFFKTDEDWDNNTPFCSISYGVDLADVRALDAKFCEVATRGITAEMATAGDNIRGWILSEGLLRVCRDRADADSRRIFNEQGADCRGFRVIINRPEAFPTEAELRSEGIKKLSEHLGRLLLPRR